MDPKAKIARLSALKQLKKDMGGKAFGKKQVDDEADEPDENEPLQPEPASLKSAEKGAMVEDERDGGSDDEMEGLKDFMKNKRPPSKLKTSVMIAIGKPAPGAAMRKKK